MLRGIDVSVYQGNIDWEKVKPQIDFAILRCGLGDDIQSQDDKQFERNYAECVRLGIPFAVYFFSYAINTPKVSKEIAHIKRLLNGKKITAPVYIDVENTKGLNWRSISNADMLAIMQEFDRQLNALGYKMGIYSSRSAFWNEKMTDKWYDNISKWVAEYGSQVNDFNRPYDIWQYSSKGSVNGIDGNVDMNNMYNNIFTVNETEPTEPKNPTKTIETLVQEVIAGKWGNGTERKNRLTAAGYNYDEVQNAVNALYKNPTKPISKVNYYPKYCGTSGSIVMALNSIGVTSTYTYRKKIAKANGITAYMGTASQNIKLLKLLKQGKLIKP